MNAFAALCTICAFLRAHPYFCFLAILTLPWIKAGIIKVVKRMMGRLAWLLLWSCAALWGIVWINNDLVCLSCHLTILQKWLTISPDFPLDKSLPIWASWCVLCALFVISFIWFRCRDPRQMTSKMEPLTTDAATINALIKDAIASQVSKLLAPQASESSLSGLIDEIRELRQLIALNVQSRPDHTAICMLLSELQSTMQEEGATTRQTLRENFSVCAEFQSDNECEDFEEEDDDVDNTPIPSIPVPQVNVATPAAPEAKKNKPKKGNYPRARRPQQPKQPQQSSTPSSSTPSSSSPQPRPTPLTSANKMEVQTLTEADLTNLVGMDVLQAAQHLNEVAKGIRIARRKPLYLSSEERELAMKSLADLDQQWKIEADRALIPSDAETIGTLTSEEAEFTRPTIREIIRIRRNKNYINRMAEMGVSLKVCDQCHTVVSDKHTCVATNWTFAPKTKSQVPKKGNITITQQGRGDIHIKNRVFPDAEAVNKAYRNIAEVKNLLEQQCNAAQSTQHQDTSPTTPEVEASMDTTVDVLSTFAVNTLLVHSIKRLFHLA